jgi:hypothetical protein
MLVNRRSASRISAVDAPKADVNAHCYPPTPHRVILCMDSAQSMQMISQLNAKLTDVRRGVDVLRRSLVRHLPWVNVLGASCGAENLGLCIPYGSIDR